MERMYRGTIPADGRLVGTMEDWAIYQRPNADASWRSVKVVSMAPRVRKANFWLSYNVQNGRYASADDSRILHTDEYGALRAWLTAILPTLPVMQGQARG